MERPRLMLLAAALVCTAVLAGCGGSSSSSTASSSSSTPAKTISSPVGPVSGKTDTEKAISECKKIIESETKLPSGAKTKLEGACSQAAKGNTSAVKAVAKEVCEEVIDKSGVPSGSAKEEALKACNK